MTSCCFVFLEILYAPLVAARARKRALAESASHVDHSQKAIKNSLESMEGSDLNAQQQSEITRVDCVGMDLRSFYTMWPADPAVWGDDDEKEQDSENYSNIDFDNGEENGVGEDVGEGRKDGYEKVQTRVRPDRECVSVGDSDRDSDSDISEEYPAAPGFFAVVAPVDAGKTHLGLSLSMHSTLQVVHVTHVPDSETATTACPADP